MNDVLDITQTVATFAFRYQRWWEELRNLFHSNATISVTWYSGPIEGFIEWSSQMAAAGRPVPSKHWIGASKARPGISCEVPETTRSFTQTPAHLNL